MQKFTELSPDALTDPKVLQAYGYWKDACKGRPMPSRADLDPLDLRSCMGWICLIDVIDGPVRRFRFRLDGSRITHIAGKDFTNKFVDEIEDEAYATFLTAIYNRTVELKTGLFISNSEKWVNRGYSMQSATLPLSDDGVRVTGIIEVISPRASAQP